MANILTAAEAAIVLRCDVTDANMLALLPLVDSYIKNATGRDWAADTSIRAEAKNAARILLVRAHEDPGAMAQPTYSLSWGLSGCLTQLEAIAASYRDFQGRDGVGECTLLGARVGDTVSSLIGLVGVTGDQSSKFETTITVKDEIQQTSTSDLSANWYQALLTRVGEL